MGYSQSKFEQEKTWRVVSRGSIRFYDEFAVQLFDDEDSKLEDRFLMLGFSDEARLLLACHCERNQGNTIRIISARKATKIEGKYYQRMTP